MRPDRRSIAALGLALAGGSAFAPCAVAQEAPQPPRAPRSVLVITLDTTRRDFVGFMGRSPSPTPMLDHLAEASVVFDDAMTTAPLTLPAHCSLLTGAYPARHGVRDNSLYRVPAEARTLAEILHDHGYATRASVAAFVLDPVFGLDQGFDRYRAPPRSGTALQNELDARTAVDRAIEDLRELVRPEAGAAAARPFFYWLHLFDPHTPYAAPGEPPLPADVKGDPLRETRAHYEAEIRFADREIGRLFGTLHTMGAFEQLVIVVAADHGESLGDAPEDSHGYFLFDPTVRVPLLIRSPDATPQRVKVPVSLIDVAPTLLALLGIEAGADRFDGLDLTPWFRDAGQPAPDRALMLESLCAWNAFGWAPLVGCTRAELKYVRSAHDALYDRAADPLEKKNLIETEPARAAPLSRTVDHFLREVTPLAPPASGISEADRARLRALGYAASGGASELPEDWSTLPDPLTKAATMERFTRIFIAESRGDVAAAIEQLKALIADEPKSAAVREQLGLLLLALGGERIEEAASELDATLALDPRRARAWWARARCAELVAAKERTAAQAARERGDREGARPHATAERAARDLAEAAARKCLECEPDYPEALQLLARSLTMRGEIALLRRETEPARAAFTEALATIERLLAVLPPASLGWTEEATHRAQLKARLAGIEGGR